MIKFKAKLGSWSSVIGGMPILLLNEKGANVAQVKILNAISRENYEDIARYIVDKLNEESYEFHELDGRDLI